MLASEKSVLHGSAENNLDDNELGKPPIDCSLLCDRVRFRFQDSDKAFDLRLNAFP